MARRWKAGLFPAVRRRSERTLTLAEQEDGLLRPYFPEKIDSAGYSQADLDKVA